MRRFLLALLLLWAPVAIAGAPIQADLHVLYPNAGTVHYENCYYCDATFSAAGGGYALLRFQQGDGYTIWSVDITATPDHRYDVTIYLIDNNNLLPTEIQGFYFKQGNANGKVALSAAELKNGGLVSGHFRDVSAFKDDGSEAVLSGAFSAVLGTTISNF